MPAEESALWPEMPPRPAANQAHSKTRPFRTGAVGVGRRKAARHIAKNS